MNHHTQQRQRQRQQQQRKVLWEVVMALRTSTTRWLLNKSTTVKIAIKKQNESHLALPARSLCHAAAVVVDASDKREPAWAVTSMEQP